MENNKINRITPKKVTGILNGLLFLIYIVNGIISKYDLLALQLSEKISVIIFSLWLINIYLFLLVGATIKYIDEVFLLLILMACIINSFDLLNISLLGYFTYFLCFIYFGYYYKINLSGKKINDLIFYAIVLTGNLFLLIDIFDLLDFTFSSYVIIFTLMLSGLISFGIVTIPFSDRQVSEK